MRAKDYRHEVADTVIKDLRRAGVASWIGYREDRLAIQQEPSSWATLHVTLTAGVFNRNLTLYGLSFAGVALWFVGLPTSYGSAELGLRAALHDAAGESLDSRDFARDESVIEWLYRPTGPAFTHTMVEMYADMSPELRAFVRDTLAHRP